MVPGQRGWAGLPASACQCPACWRSWVQIPALSATSCHLGGGGVCWAGLRGSLQPRPLRSEGWTLATGATWLAEAGSQG